ncbi:MAG: carboxymuconolactone decarboxylase family protein [Terriglobia bacterium]
MASDETQKGKKVPASMGMIDPRFRRIYMSFYKESYYTPTALDLKTKELIAIAASAVAKCQGCLDGHIKKALELGLSKDEISDAIVVAIGIAAAAVVDMTDHAAIELDLHHFDVEKKSVTSDR